MGKKGAKDKTDKERPICGLIENKKSPGRTILTRKHRKKKLVAENEREKEQKIQTRSAQKRQPSRRDPIICLKKKASPEGSKGDERWGQTWKAEPSTIGRKGPKSDGPVTNTRAPYQGGRPRLSLLQKRSNQAASRQKETRLAQKQKEKKGRKQVHIVQKSRTVGRKRGKPKRGKNRRSHCDMNPTGHTQRRKKTRWEVSTTNQQGN